MNRFTQAFWALIDGMVVKADGGRVPIDRIADHGDVAFYKERADRWYSELSKALREREQLRKRESKRRSKNANTIRSLTAQLKAQAAAHKRWRDEHPGLQAAVDGVVAEMQRKLDEANKRADNAEEIAKRRISEARHAQHEIADLGRKLDQAHRHREKAEELLRDVDAKREVAEINLKQLQAAHAKSNEAIAKVEAELKAATSDRAHFLRERNEFLLQRDEARREMAETRSKLSAVEAELQRVNDELARQDDVVEPAAEVRP